jgi:hypothetical protein
MKVGCQHLFRNSFKALSIGFLDRSNWRQALHITTVLHLYASRDVLADLFHESHRLDW